MAVVVLPIVDQQHGATIGAEAIVQPSQYGSDALTVAEPEGEQHEAR